MSEKRHLDDDALQALAEGEGSPEAARHLQRCASCRRAVEDYRSLFSTLEREDWIPGTPDLVPAVLSAVRRDARARRGRLLAWVKASVIVSAAAVLLGILVFFEGGGWVRERIPEVPAAVSHRMADLGTAAGIESRFAAGAGTLGEAAQRILEEAEGAFRSGAAPGVPLILVLVLLALVQGAAFWRMRKRTNA
jgi:hypothetical protein